MSAALRTRSRDALRIIVVGTDSAEALRLERLCGAILGDRLERFETSHPAAAEVRLREAGFDVVLLDPDLQAGGLLELLPAVSMGAGRCVVVSAQADLALRAFEYGVLDFVPKPVRPERLALALRRAHSVGGPPAPAQPFLAVRRLGRVDFVAVDDLLYVEGADKYSELVLANGQRNFYDKCLGRLEATLPRNFIRIHKSYLVRFSLITRLHVQRGSRYFAELKGGHRLPVGRSRYETIKARLI